MFFPRFILSITVLIFIVSSVQAQPPTPTRTPTPINVGNFVWDDLDKDGRQDAGEPGLAGVTVQLWNSGKTQLLDSAITNSSGIYKLVAPLPGSYRVRVLLPAVDDEFSPVNQAGGDDQLDNDVNPTGTNFGFTDTYTFASNLISITTIDAGIIKFRPPTPTRTPTPINLGNFVWNDLNQNGVQNAGEPGLVGITVQLWNSTKTALLDSTTTNGSGNYTLVAPLPGDYRIRVLAPTGSSFTLKDQGSSDTQDSDFNPTGINTGFTDVISIASNVISITSIDAGLINVPATPIFTPTFTSTHTATLPPLTTPTFTPQPNLTPTATPLPDTSVELLTNGSFEVDLNPQNNQPDNWTITGKSQDRLKCNTATTLFAYAGQCAYRFKGAVGENAKLAQKPDISAYQFADGDTLVMQVLYKTNPVKPKLKIRVRVFYTDQAPTKFNITLNTIAPDYIPYTSPAIVLVDSVNRIKVDFRNKATSGKIYLDDASLIFTP